jgi:hypothetical protein
MPVTVYVCASPRLTAGNRRGLAKKPRSSYRVYINCPLLVLISFVPSPLQKRTAAYVKRNLHADPENHKAEHWGYHAPRWSWYFYPTLSVYRPRLIRFPSILSGTWKSNPGDVGRAVETALKNGYRHIDTASGYG